MTRPILLTLTLLLIPALAWSGSDPVRVLTGGKFMRNGESWALLLDLEHNGEKPIGRMYESGRWMHLEFTNAKMSNPAYHIAASGKDVKRILLLDRRRNIVQVSLRFARSARELMEDIAIVKGEDYVAIGYPRGAAMALLASEGIGSAPASVPGQEDAEIGERGEAGIDELLQDLSLDSSAVRNSHDSIVPPPVRAQARPADNRASAMFGRRAYAQAGLGQGPQEETASNSIRDGADDAVKPVATGRSASNRSYLLVLLLLGSVGGFWFLFKSSKGKALRNLLDPSGEDLEILTNRSLGGKQRLLLVNLEGRKLLLGATEQNINLLCDMSGRHQQPSAQPYPPVQLQQATAQHPPQNLPATPPSVQPAQRVTRMPSTRTQPMGGQEPDRGLVSLLRKMKQQRLQRERQMRHTKPTTTKVKVSEPQDYDAMLKQAAERGGNPLTAMAGAVNASGAEDAASGLRRRFQHKQQR